MGRSHDSLLTVLLTVLFVALLVLAGCSSGSGTTSASGGAGSSARTTACTGLASINQALASLAGTQASSTVGDVQAAQQKVSTAVSAIETKIPAASGPLLDQVKTANDNLTEKLQGYPPDTPIGQTSDTVQDIKAKVTNAQAKTTLLATALKCTS